jgi:ubiquinone biosynthesis protein
VLRALRNLGRLFAIARTLARHDALFPFEAAGVPGPALKLARRLWPSRDPDLAGRRPGQRLALALQRLGPSFIKLGQALSTRADLVGREVADDLSHLRDRLPPFPGAEARAAIAADLGQAVEELFASFDDEPVAAASIAQVHFATVREIAADEEGEKISEVAVKVLRPGIEAAFRRDLDLFFWLAESAERLRPELRRLKPMETVQAFAETVDLEMDLRLEAAAASELAENRSGDHSFYVPEVDWQRTSRRVLTTARIRGIPISDVDGLRAAGHDLDGLAAKLIGAFLSQALGQGFFHADLHPGNLFVDEAGDIGAVDFGIMGRLDRTTRRYVAELLLAFATADYRRAAEVHFEAGYVPASKSVDAFAQACRSIAEPILGRPAEQISMGRLLAQLFEITRTFEMETQPQLLLLQKTMVVAEGVGRDLSPELNMWEIVVPVLETCVADILGVDVRMREAAEGTAALARRIPELVDKAERATGLVAEGGVKLHPDTARDIADAQARRRRPVLTLLWLAVILLLLVLVLKD